MVRTCRVKRRNGTKGIYGRNIGRRSRGTPSKTYLRNEEEDLKEMEIRVWRRKVQDTRE